MQRCVIANHGLIRENSMFSIDVRLCKAQLSFHKEGHVECCTLIPTSLPKPISVSFYKPHPPAVEVVKFPMHYIHVVCHIYLGVSHVTTHLHSVTLYMNVRMNNFNSFSQCAGRYDICDKLLRWVCVYLIT